MLKMTVSTSELSEPGGIDGADVSHEREAAHCRSMHHAGDRPCAGPLSVSHWCSLTQQGRMADIQWEQRIWPELHARVGTHAQGLWAAGRGLMRTTGVSPK